MRRRTLPLVLAMAALLPGLAGAAGPGAAAGRGLLWNRSGLPAGLPMVLQFDPGADWVVTLRDPGTGRDVLAAGASGTSPLRVLVPPGRWTVQAAPAQPDGTESADGTTRATGPDEARTRDLGTLDFGPAGVARRGGWRLDLRGGGAEAHPTALCQDALAGTALPDRAEPPHDPARRSLLLRAPAPGDLPRTLRDLRDPPRQLPIAAPETRRVQRPCD
ncbi:hypothetical protein [Frigidibacter sp. MR17.24]|uniref:hypothetical protein n=1 Tax=Frigidibacter sp. MR17.24 TaxID=3127345 RepID=UPI003012C960